MHLVRSLLQSPLLLCKEIILCIGDRREEEDIEREEERANLLFRRNTFDNLLNGGTLERRSSLSEPNLKMIDLE